MDTTTADPLVGRLLDGRYRVESRIARGGMASVYLALDVRLDRTVAVKVMHRSLAEDPAFVRRFIGEAKSVASLSHPNIVHVFDQGTDGDVVYLSMEYVPGRTLRDVLRERGRLSAREALEIMIPVLAALGAAHQAGMAHRDVKPENVLLTDDGRVKVVDFGLARAIEATNQTRTGVMIGTIGYMAPEQVTTGGADVRSDVYASGIMLFELVTGRQPYDGQTPMAVAYKHVHETVPPPSSLVPETSPLIDTLVATATAHDPAARYQDASAMLVAAVDAHRLLPRLSTPPTGSGAHLLTPPPMASGPHAVPPGPVPPATVPPAPQRTLIQPRADVLTAPPARRSWRPHWFLVGLAALMVVAIGLTAWFVSRPTMITLPDLTSLNLVSAQQKAASLGLDVKVLDGRHDDKVPEGRVLSMNPPAGTEVEEKSTVQLVPSLGPKLVMVPGVRDMTEEQARVLITQAGLKVGKVRRMENPDVQRGLVMETRPPAGERVKEGTAVELRISAGLTMPDVGGMSRDEAKAHLESLGLQVQVHEVNDDNEPCTVIAQVPKAKTEIDKGQAVQITVVNCGFSFVWPWGDHEARDDSQVVVVPSVLGKQVGDAKRELEQLGFKVRVRRAAGTGVVAYQHPRDTERPAGWTVTIWH
ncbi:Stk1 family PASTA domain-containing Ser/Thr kinase [Thermoactinospora rubra]|uniref:Stk1 family PASTA domain-containing Ser/Thr kinase n=1 Tax=Thermoactinospora rubra TaxID=1088767 RepID=UPI000A116748|nr:Stk1 family PASTA domain-containing Ser/Thr kinase [Thermoactinospora rubra]